MPAGCSDGPETANGVAAVAAITARLSVAVAAVAAGPAASRNVDRRDADADRTIARRRSDRCGAALTEPAIAAIAAGIAA